MVTSKGRRPRAVLTVLVAFVAVLGLPMSQAAANVGDTGFTVDAEFGDKNSGVERVKLPIGGNTKVHVHIDPHNKTGGPVTVNFEQAGGAGGQAGNDVLTPDATCVIPSGGGQCDTELLTLFPGSTSAQGVFRVVAWINATGKCSADWIPCDNTNEGVDDVDSDETDVLEVTVNKVSSVGLSCDPKRQNISKGATPQSVTCVQRDQDGNPVPAGQGAAVDVEQVSGGDDPDNGNHDPADAQAVSGPSSFPYVPGTSVNNSARVFCAWLDTDNDGESAGQTANDGSNCEAAAANLAAGGSGEIDGNTAAFCVGNGVSCPGKVTGPPPPPPPGDGLKVLSFQAGSGCNGTVLLGILPGTGSHTATASDSLGQTVTLTSTAPPPGWLSFSSAPGSPVSGTLEWNPTIQNSLLNPAFYPHAISGTPVTITASKDDGSSVPCSFLVRYGLGLSKFISPRSAE